MKVKPIINNNLTNKVRFNNNVIGTHLSIKKGTYNEDKKDYSTLVLLSLMYEQGFIKQDVLDSKQVINTISNNSKQIINNYLLNKKGNYND